jgi:hypothetical protein
VAFMLMVALAQGIVGSGGPYQGNTGEPKASVRASLHVISRPDWGRALMTVRHLLP